MDLAQLRYFHAVARQGSFTAAARALKVSQPTLTVAVKNLEEKLGTTLFHRSHEGVKLTRTGQELIEHAEQVFLILDRAEERIVGLESDEVGRFVIGCHESLGAYFLPAFMRKFLDAAPRIELSLWNGTSAVVTDAILDRQVDFGLVVNPRPHPDLVLVQLFHDAVDVIVATASLLRAPAPAVGRGAVEADDGALPQTPGLGAVYPGAGGGARAHPSGGR